MSQPFDRVPEFMSDQPGAAKRTPQAQTWPFSPARRATDRYMAWGMLDLALIVITVSAGFVLAPDEVTWRHFVVAGILMIKGLILLYISSNLVRLVIRDKGRRRAS